MRAIFGSIQWQPIELNRPALRTSNLRQTRFLSMEPLQCPQVYSTRLAACSSRPAYLVCAPRCPCSRSRVGLSPQSGQSGTGRHSGGRAGARALSIDEAVDLALEQNLGIRSSGSTRRSRTSPIAQARSNWAPDSSTTAQQQLEEQSADQRALRWTDRRSPTRGSRRSSACNQMLPTGANYSLAGTAPGRARRTSSTTSTR